jgi:16S rRNA G966 N2-methylase RsmD
LLDREPGWLAEGAIVVAQHDPSEGTALELAHLAAADERSYGRVTFTFFQPVRR